ncbi:unnamed protein product, partial [Durusdinium trenchii]
GAAKRQPALGEGTGTRTGNAQNSGPDAWLKNVKDPVVAAAKLRKQTMRMWSTLVDKL